MRVQQAVRAAVVAAAAVLGCGGGGGDEGASTGSDSTGGSGSTGTTAGTTASTTATTTMGTTATTTVGTDSATDPTLGDSSSSETGEPAEPAVHWVGRTDTSDPTRTRVGWSGAGLVVRFSGTGASVRMDDPAQFWTVVLDGAVQPRLQTQPGEQDYVLATGLAAGEHVVELYRRTEGSFGATSILAVDLEGELLAPPPVTRRIEIIGDSITCGYGDEGVSPCSFSADTENHYLTYGAVAARAVGAELHTIAWSGKGVIYNYGDDTFEPMPQLYDRTLASEGTSWDYSWQPDAVLVNLGTNDFSTDNDPSQQQFVDAYLAFAAHLREVNPDAFILLLSPSLFGDEATMVDGYLQQVVDGRMGAGDTAIAWANINVPWEGSGCDGHPNVATHMGMADQLVAQLQSHLGW
ncbi:MAG: SGNH/GDSL hydrolase family protein [Nannocystaceae bacterium]